MEVIPAIDIRAGRCVRLYQGDYGRETVYSDNPVEMATRWVDMGASRLHIVDLDGARDGSQVNLHVVERIVEAAGVPVQLGGGIRDEESATAATSVGVDRVIIGTAAVDDPDSVRRICDRLGPERVLVSVDARDGLVALEGWTKPSRVGARELMMQMSGLGVDRFLYTDVSRDGTLTEPNFAAIRSLLEPPAPRLLAAGGVTSISHLQQLEALGVEGAVVGTAIYTGDLDLKVALAALGRGASNRT